MSMDMAEYLEEEEVQKLNREYRLGTKEGICRMYV